MTTATENWSPARPARDAMSLRRLELTVTRKLDGLLLGDHHGLLPAAGSEAASGRPYVPGDDARRIDWNLSARSLETHVRTTDADRELETWVVVDTSASCDFGTARSEKRDLVAAMVASFGFLTLRDGNRLGAVLAGGDRLVTVPARAGRPPLVALLGRLLSLPRRDTAPAAGATLAAALDRLHSVHRRRGAVVLVSDLLESADGPGGWARPLRRLAHRHHVVAAEVRDPREVELPAVGLLTVVDPETGRRLEVQTASARLRERFAAAAAEQRAARAQSVRAAGANHLVLSTDRDWLVDVVRFVVAARRRSAALNVGITR